VADQGLATAMGREVAGILAVVGRVDMGHGLMVQFLVDVDEGEQAGVGEGLCGPVAADALDVGLDADETAAGIDDPCGVVQLVAHAHRVKKVDPVDRRRDGPVGGHLLGTDGRQFVSAADEVAAEDLLGDVFLLKPGSS
jgi:hypothetical protein